MPNLILFITTVLLVACSVHPPEVTSPLPNQVLQNENQHFVEVVLPAEEKSQGAEIVLSIEGREPLLKTVSANDPASPPKVRFEVGETVAPAQLSIKFTNGEVRELSKVIFDTTLTLQ